MAPASATSTGNSTSTSTTLPISPQPASPSFAGEEFSNNLFSDLAPLLTLFGEQVTKQFLSMSMGWADHIMLGMGPLGVITAVVSAIRVGGVSKLKALIGRARESRVTAEIELLSSTSPNVCELWNGREFVRLAGQPRILDCFLTEDEMVVRECKIPRALDLNVLTGFWNSCQRTKGAPNLALNAGTIASNFEKWAIAIIALNLQTVAIVLPAVSTYHWHWKKGSKDAPEYAYPCYLAGTLAVCLGVALCSRAIDLATEEIHLIPSRERKTGSVFHIQLACTIGDQDFPDTLIMNNDSNHGIRMSRLRAVSRGVRNTSVVATVFAIGGFICQFVGLRALHWSATVIQLGATLLMTAIRAWVRRGLADKYRCHAIPPRVDDISMSLGFRCMAQTKEVPGAFDRAFDGEFGKYGDASWVIPTAWSWSTLDEPSRMQGDHLPMQDDPRIDIRIMLQPFVTDQKQDTLMRMAERLYNAFFSTLLCWEHALRDKDPQSPTMVSDLEDLSWTLPVHSFSRGLRMRHEGLLRLTCPKADGWKPPKNISEYHAMLSMWSSTLPTDDGSYIRPYLRVLGHWLRYSLASLEGLPRWIGGSLAVEPVPFGHHRVEYELVNDNLLFGLSLNAYGKVSTDLSPDAVKSTMQERPAQYYTDQERLSKSWEEKKKRRCLYFVSNLSVKTQCALEIFSGCIQALAESTESLGKLTWPGDFDAHPDEAAYGCRLLHRLSQALVSSELVPNIVEANAIIIPPFARRGLLDRGPDHQTSAADVSETVSSSQDYGASDTEESEQSSPEDGTAVDDAQVPRIDAELDEISAAIAPGGPSSQTVSEARGIDEITESTSDDVTVADEAQMSGIELQPLHLTK